MDTVFQDALKDLTETQIEFLCAEFGLSKEDLLAAEESLLDEFYDQLCDMEVEEITEAGKGELSDRGKIVSAIVTTFGNAIAENCGLFDEDFEDDLEAE